MPNVTISTDYSEPIPLKSAPPDGFICVRPMPFGRMLKRRDTASKMSMETQGRGRNNSNNDPSKISIETLQYHARIQEFAYCIGDHNLTDVNDRKLDFSNAMSLDALHPKVGAEIEAILDKLNSEEEEDTEDFTQPASNSTEETTPLSTE